MHVCLLSVLLETMSRPTPSLNANERRQKKQLFWFLRAAVDTMFDLHFVSHVYQRLLASSLLSASSLLNPRTIAHAATEVDFPVFPIADLSDPGRFPVIEGTKIDKELKDKAVQILSCRPTSIQSAHIRLVVSSPFNHKYRNEHVSKKDAAQIYGLLAKAINIRDLRSDFFKIFSIPIANQKKKGSTSCVRIRLGHFFGPSSI
jgi:hypothetical protein